MPDKRIQEISVKNRNSLVWSNKDVLPGNELRQLEQKGSEALPPDCVHITLSIVRVKSQIGKVLMSHSFKYNYWHSEE